MAQAILDLFPDAVSQFGLIGCGMAVLMVAAAVAGFIVAITE